MSFSLSSFYWTADCVGLLDFTLGIFTCSVVVLALYVSLFHIDSCVEDVFSSLIFVEQLTYLVSWILFQESFLIKLYLWLFVTIFNIHFYVNFLLFGCLQCVVS